MTGMPARRSVVRTILVVITLATLPLYCLGYLVLQRAQAQFRVNFPTPTGSSTRVETLQVFVPATRAPGVTSTSPERVSTPTLSSGAEDFVRQYFQLIEQRAYSQTWAMLSAHYRQQHNPTGFQPYVDFWNTIQSVEIVTVQPQQQDSQSARLLVQLAFHFTDGKNSAQAITFSLVADAPSGSWLIDDTY
jgi:hypothetical protein